MDHPPPPLIARAADPDSLRAAALLYERVGRAAFAWRPQGYYKADDFIVFARDEEVYLALLDGAIVGLATLYRPDSFLHLLFVDVASRGRGIGSALLTHVREHAGAPLTLKVDTPNAAAIAFYQRMGGLALDGPNDSGVDEGVPWRRYRIG